MTHMAPKIRDEKQVSVHNLRSHSISTFNRYDRRIVAAPQYNKVLDLETHLSTPISSQTLIIGVYRFALTINTNPIS